MISYNTSSFQDCVQFLSLHHREITSTAQWCEFMLKHEGLAVELLGKAMADAFAGRSGWSSSSPDFHRQSKNRGSVTFMGNSMDWVKKKLAY